jgi:hypothetical protein
MGNQKDKILTDEELEYKIEIATQTLDRNIGFVSNCDNKTSIALTAFGVLLTLILSDDGIQKLSSIITACLSEPQLIDILYLGALGISVILTIAGMVELGCVLVPNTSGKYASDSLIFFSGILQNQKHSKYQNRFLSMTREDLLKDLTNEIYENAKIATRKYQQYGTGLKFSSIGFALFLMFYLLGISFY